VTCVIYCSLLVKSLVDTVYFHIISNLSLLQYMNHLFSLFNFLFISLMIALADVYTFEQKP
jgi:hypothetical protein